MVPADGGSVCPTAADVAAGAAALLSGAPGGTAVDVVDVRDEAAGVRVTLRRASGGVIGQRTFAPGFACADLAAAAAVVVATWESDVHPEFTLQLPVPAVAPATASPALVFPVVPPPPPVVADAPSSPSPRTEPPATVRREVPRPSLASPLPRVRALDLGVGLFGSMAPTSDALGAALGVSLVAGWTPRGEGTGGRLTVLLPSERSLQLSAGRVNWRRPAIALGANRRWLSPGRAWAVDVHADAVAAWTLLRGAGFTSNLTAGTLDPAMGAGVRLTFRHRWVAPWLDLSALGWLRRQTALEAASGASRQLPRVEAMVTLGGSYLGAR